MEDAVSAIGVDDERNKEFLKKLDKANIRIRKLNMRCKQYDLLTNDNFKIESNKHFK